MSHNGNRKQWQYVLVYKLDRFSRNKFESVIHKKTLRDNGVVILSAMENLTDTPEGRMMETVLEGFNQYFSEELTQKVNRGLKESWRKGNATGGQDIFGYDVVNKKYIINEYEANIVEEALSKRKKRAKCNAKPVHKQWLEDTVINATAKMLGNVDNIRTIANAVFQAHKKETADNTALKLLERKRAEAVKAQNNIVRAIEQGIITETTKSRLTELETLIAQYDFDISKEKVKSYTFLTVEQIEMYLSKFVFEDTSEIKVRKLLVNTFIREM